MTTHNENIARREQYQAPACNIVEIETEPMIAATGTASVMRGGTDTEANKGTGGFTWAEVKGNTVDWDDAE
jgi:hypothetical protein